MIRTLVEKEFREHWLALAATLGLSLLGLCIITLAAMVTAEDGNALESLRVFLTTFGVIAAMVICSRLVVREYQSKTQLFLESLPLTRTRMIAVKYVLGLSILFGMTALALAALLPMVARHQSLTVLFAGIVAARAFSFVFFVYSFFFATGMLGRYRMVIYVGIVVGLVVLTTTTDLELNRFGPLAVMDRTFPFERETFPLAAVTMTLGLGAAFSAIAFLLALMREGTVAAMLAEKMSHREKVFVTAVLLGIVFLGGMFDEKQRKQPFDLPGAIVEDSGRATVKLLVGQLQDVEAGEALAARIHTELAAVVEYLGLEYSPPVFITTRRDLDANRYELGELVNGEGLLARVNFSAAEFDAGRFLVWLVREFLIMATEGRARLESKMWVLDGFGPFWLQRGSGYKSLAAHGPLALRAIYGTSEKENGLTETDFANWLRFRDSVGEGIAAGVAWSALDVLARRQGPERAQAFLRAVLGNGVPNDVRALWFEHRNPVRAQLEQNAGMPLTQFIAAWREELDGARASLRNELLRLPRVSGDVSFEALSPDTRLARYRVTVNPSRNAGGPYRVTLLHANLFAFATEVAPNDLQREDITPENAAAGELEGTWTRGDRFYSTFSLEVAELGCEVISGWTRREIR